MERLKSKSTKSDDDLALLCFRTTFRLSVAH